MGGALALSAATILSGGVDLLKDGCICQRMRLTSSRPDIYIHLVAVLFNTSLAIKPFHS